MALVSRVAKTGGGGSDQFTAATSPLQRAELDQDLNAIVAGVNAISDANVDPAAAISASKLALTGAITNVMVNASAAIVGTKLADNTIPAAKYGDLSIAVGKLAVGAGLASSFYGAQELTTDLPLGTPTVLFEGVKGARTGPILVVAILQGQWLWTGSGGFAGTEYATLSIYEGGTTMVVDGTLRRQVTASPKGVTLDGVANDRLPWSLTTIWFAATSTASQRFKCVIDGGSGLAVKPQRMSAYLLGIELA